MNNKDSANMMTIYECAQDAGLSLVKRAIRVAAAAGVMNSGIPANWGREAANLLRAVSRGKLTKGEAGEKMKRLEVMFRGKETNQRQD